MYPSEKPYECDVFYSCLNGVGSPTRCPEGLHYSETEGICVWARDSGRSGCGLVPAEEDRRRRKKKEPAAAKKQEKEEVRTLPNGFRCPGGKLGVHVALAHPTDCRSYYVCLNGRYNSSLFQIINKMCTCMHLAPSFHTYFWFLPGVEASEQGCTKGQVFNPATSACDKPDRVPGCENYYRKPTKTKVIGSFVVLQKVASECS